MQGAGFIASGLSAFAVALTGCAPSDTPEARGLTLTQDVGCGACHVIPGVDWPQGRVGPPLDAWGERGLIAGRFPNDPETLSRWVRDAPSMAPESGMTPMPLTEDEADAVAAYLLSLK